MRQRLVVIVFLGIVALSLFGWLNLANRYEVNSVQAVRGQLTPLSFEEDQLISLHGEWEYYPNQLAPDLVQRPSKAWAVVEHEWPVDSATGKAFGFATYQLTINGLQPEHVYGLFIQDEFSAYKLSVNGIPVAGNGQVAKDRADYRPQVFSTTGYFSADASGRAILTMEIANFTRAKGGFINAPILGRADMVDFYHNLLLSSEILILASSLALGILFALLSLSMQDRRISLMAVFLFMIVFRLLNTGVHLIQILFMELPMSVILPLEYITGYLLIPLAGLLLEAFGFDRKHTLLQRIYLVSIPVIILLFAILPNSVLSASYLVFAGILVVLAIYSIFLLAKGVQRHEKGIFYVVAGFTALITGGLIEFSPYRSRYSLFFAAMLFILALSTYVVLQLATLQSNHDRLATEVLTDTLTGLGNRESLFHQLDRWQQRRDQASLAILFCDLNRFKAINDTYGHATGDELLRLSAKRLQGCMRASDQVYRVGGDEFVILAELKKDEPADAFVPRIKDCFKQPFAIENWILHVSISVGAEPFIPGQDTADDVMSRSDARMYEDKRRESVTGITI